MKLGDLAIGGSWKITLLKIAFIAILLGGCFWMYKEYRTAQATTQELREQQIEIEARYKALEARVEESAKRTERRLDAVAVQAQEYANESDINDLVSDINAELDRFRSGDVQPED